MPEDISKVQADAMNKLVELATKRTEMSANRTYMNAERTLSVWIRTALAAMIFGLALDRLDIILQQVSSTAKVPIQGPDVLTHVLGIALIVYSMAMSLLSSIQFLTFCRSYRKKFPIPPAHRAWLPFSYAILVLLFGIGLLALVIWIG